MSVGWLNNVALAFAALPVWKKTVMVLASSLIVTGLGLEGASSLSGTANETARDPAHTTPGAQLQIGERRRTPDSSLVPETRPIPPYGRKEPSPWPRPESEPPPEDPSSASKWSPSLIKGGFSFFAAFCLGLALRTFAKLSLFVFGVVFLILSGLSYGGYIEVHWERIGAQFDSLAATFRNGFGDFKSFLQGSLPSTAMAGVGFLAGVRKK